MVGFVIKMKNLKIICEARSDKNIFYYLNDFQYGVFERTMNNWDVDLLGKFSIQKCLDYLEDLGEYYEINDKNWSFGNIKKEEKLHEKIENVKGLEPGIIIYEEM